jgi:hypothetical protein
MKRYYPLLLLVVLTSCLGYKELPVEYDYSYKGNFKRYRTFNMLSSTSGDETMTNEIIEKSIVSRMKFLSYKQSEAKPHLVISFKMFSDSMAFNGYQQPEIEEWAVTQNENLNYERQKFDLKTGTLLIQFYDRRQNRSIWQGYATTQYGSIDFNNDRHLKNAVISILDKYRFWAEGFMDGTKEIVEKDIIP